MNTRQIFFSASRRRHFRRCIVLKPKNQEIEKLIEALGGRVPDHPDFNVVCLAHKALLGVEITSMRIRKDCHVGYYHANTIIGELEERGVLKKTESKSPLLDKFDD